MGYDWKNEEEVMAYFDRRADMEFLADTHPLASWVPCFIQEIGPVYAQEGWILKMTLEFVEASLAVRLAYPEGATMIQGLDQIRNRVRPRKERE